GIDDEAPERSRLELLASDDVDGEDLAAGRYQFGGPLEQRVGIAEEVADDRHPPARAQHGEHGGERPRPAGDDTPEDALDVGHGVRGGARREDLDARAADDGESHGVAVADGHGGEA